MKGSTRENSRPATPCPEPGVGPPPAGPAGPRARFGVGVALALGAALVLSATAGPVHGPPAGPASSGQDGAASEQVPLESAEAILRSFAEDYAEDPSLKRDVTFGIVLGHDDWWTVVARPAGETSPASVDLVRGEPEEPTFFFTLDYPTLVRIDKGEINAMTAMVRGLASDPAPMGTRGMDGFQPPAEIGEIMLDVSFHFWTRGFPEVVPFGERHTRFVHGTDAVVLFYQPGFRSGWFSLKQGQHANADPRLQVNPFPSLLVLTRGRGVGRIGGEEIELGPGNAIFVPAGVSHEFWNPHDEPAEGFLLMFGDGA